MIAFDTTKISQPSKIEVQSFAKLNLTFEILGRLDDGYHEVRTLFHSIDLCDELSFELRKRTSVTSTEETHVRENESASKANAREMHGLRVFFVEAATHGQASSLPESFPTDESNLIVKAAHRFLQVTRCGAGYDLLVHVKKNIPIAAGLAGGSGNAAATLAALGAFFTEGKNKVDSIAAELGSDINFCLIGGTQIGSHRGEQLKKIEQAASLCFLLVKPRHIAISTPWIYKEYDRYTAEAKLSRAGVDFTSELAGAMAEGELERISQGIYNEFQAICFEHFPQVRLLHQQMLEAGCWNAGITGSGPTLFGLVPSVEAGHAVRRKLIDMHTRTAAKGRDAGTNENLGTNEILGGTLEFDSWFVQSSGRGLAIKQMC